MKLSIIIPTYNSATYIKQCLDSIYKNALNIIDSFEVIVVNDGSTDNTSDILNQYQFQNLKIYTNSNHGVSYSRNYGIGKASGKYIMFVDSDDLLIENWFNIINKYLDNNIDFLLFTKDKNIENLSKENLIKEVSGYIDNNHYFSTPWSKIFKTELIKKYNIKFIESIINGEDMLFILNYLNICSSFKIIGTSFYKYRLLPNSLTRGFDEKIFNSDLVFYNNFSEIIKKFGLSNDEETSILNFSRTNALYIILRRIAYVETYNVAKKYYMLIDKTHYCFNNYLLKSYYKNCILHLYKKNHYRIIYFIMKNQIKIFSKDDEENFVII